MILSWFKRWRRRRLLARPFPQQWTGYLARHMAIWQRLTADQQQQLQQIVAVFVAEKYWEGCGGLELSDEIKVATAGQACLLLLGIEHDYYRNVGTILVYPGGYTRHERVYKHRTGVVVERRFPVLGEAHFGGPVILSWSDARHGGRDADDGGNLVYHEFAHKLDMLDGIIDGTPPLADAEARSHWADIMSKEFKSHRRRTRKGRDTLIDPYGATNAAEFFAEATECFFERPDQMQKRHANLYDLLRRFYQQDPAARHATLAGQPS